MIKEQNNILIFAFAGFYLAIVFTLTAIFSGLGTRWALWDFRTGLKIFRWAVYAEMIAFVITLVLCILTVNKQSKPAFTLSIIGFLISISVLSIALKWMYTAKSVPAIHDITTDIENPPEFDMILKLRKDAPNPPEYGGKQISSQQIKAYPDIKPTIIKLIKIDAYELCLAIAKEMNWEIVNTKQNEGFIEATDRTFWFGFKDDIVIRITPFDNSSRIDLSSVSRVGRSDIGTNAKRIQKFLKKLENKIPRSKLRLLFILL
ncbi:DUF1499 domain-containing protein [Candidatus Desantisbacteria bacterium]|nr:DUF1499 domain-containing protein [Candidatus Desantisbacteria bacterium]